jgi:hypothetical protein
MTRPRPFQLLSLLAFVPFAIAACATERKPIRGFDTPPAGSIVLDGDPGGTIQVWPIFDLPVATAQTFRFRLNGHDAVIPYQPEGFYQYTDFMMQGWTAGWPDWLGAVPFGTYVLEIVDSSGQSWATSGQLDVSTPGGGFSDPSVVVVFTHFDGQMGTWTIDPSTKDGDATTDEVTVTSVAAEDVVVERCLITSTGDRTSCTSVGNVAPQANLRTVETLAGSSKTDHAALFIHLASDATKYYQRDLVPGASAYMSSCQVEGIFVYGARQASADPRYTVNQSIAFSTCFGSSSGPQ